MFLIRKLFEAMDRAPWLWIYDSIVLGLLVGFYLWSWRAAGYAVAGLLVILLLPWVRRVYFLAWAGCWTVVWHCLITWFIGALHTHHGFLSRLPTYIVTGAFACYFLKRMLMAVGACDVALHGWGDSETVQPETGGHGSPYEPQSPMADTPEVEVFDPHAVLCLPPDASEAQIKENYRKQMALYHPDKVDHLGDALKQTALYKTLEIQRAFELLSEDKRANI